MKTKLIICAFYLLLPLSFLHAADIYIGPSIWYSYWDPLFSEGTDNFEMDPALLYGAVFSVRFDNALSISLNAMHGEYNASWNQTITYSDASYASTSYRDIEITRDDVDLIFSYGLIERLKLFCGIKLQQYSMTGSGYYDYYNSSSVLLESGEIPYKTDSIRAGLGLGLGYNHALANSLYLNLSLSGLLISYSFGPSFPELSGGSIQQQDEKCYEYTGTGLGFNSQLQFTYYSDATNITFNCGYRLQLIKVTTSSYKSTYGGDPAYSPDYGTGSEDVYDGKVEYFHGIIFSAVYGF